MSCSSNISSKDSQKDCQSEFLDLKSIEDKIEIAKNLRIQRRMDRGRKSKACPQMENCKHSFWGNDGKENLYKNFHNRL